MKLTKTVLTIVIIVIISGCSKDDPVSPPQTGEVLVAELAGDSAGTTNGSSTKIGSISGQSLNFTDRDNIRITFYYSGTANNSTSPFNISYVQDTSEVNVFNGLNLNYSTTEQFKDTTFASPRVNASFRYLINTFNLSGFSYIKFRDLKIYKK